MNYADEINRCCFIIFLRFIVMFKKINSKAGFSLVELMVVVTIIGGLAALGIPRFRQFLANSRRAEALTNLSTIHKLQTLHQQSKDNFVEWPKSKLIGNAGGSTTRKCTWGTDGEKDATTDGAKSLGFKPSGCENMRYGYWVLRKSANGRENFLAVAFGPSDEHVRIFPTCDGVTTAARAVKVAHKDMASDADMTFDNSSAKSGDLLAIDEDKDTKTYLTTANDIIQACL